MFVVHYATVNCLRLCTMQFKNYALCTMQFENYELCTVNYALR